jgi:hypothetical protein
MPSIAEDMAKKARWYHVVTLSKRTSVISNERAENATRKRPR